VTAPDYERLYYEADEFWDGDALLGADNMRRYQQTAALIPSDALCVLDVGCGNGRFGAFVAASRQGVRVVGVDRSHKALEFVTTEKLHGDAVDLPVESGSFDCVTCLEVIEHLPVDAFELALRELTRVAGRYVIIGVPYRESIETNVTTCPQCRTTFNVDLHLRSFDQAAMAGLLTEYSFELKQLCFPGSSTKLRGLHRAWEVVRNARSRGAQPQFRSPICPVCGFRERGAAASNANIGGANVTDVGQTSSKPPRALSSLARVLRRVWPSYEDPGYWVVALYARS
jgi:SAM-dependent methyltransferase